jgi:hypothetical protein
MQLDLVITQLRTYCAAFSNRVAGAAEFAPLQESAALALPAAYVIALDDTPEPNQSAGGYQQVVRDGFAVILVVSNTADPRGQAALTSVHTLRAQVWAALLGWQPSDDYDGVVYEGGSVVAMNRAHLYYQLEFSAEMNLDATDTWLNPRNQALPSIEGVDISTDPIDPQDPNVTPPVEGGPDGIVNFVTEINLPE